MTRLHLETPELVIEPATEDDISQLLPIQSLHVMLTSPGAPDPARELGDLIARNAGSHVTETPNVLWVLHHRQRSITVGWIATHVQVDENQIEERYATISAHLKPGESGWARVAWEPIEDWLRSLGVAEIRATIDRSNGRAVRFAESIGMQRLLAPYPSYMAHLMIPWRKSLA
jgi:hypothetical protein